MTGSIPGRLPQSCVTGPSENITAVIRRALKKEEIGSALEKKDLTQAEQEQV